MNTEKTYKVYKHTFPNGKVYIGLTCQKPEYRWDHGNGYRSQLVIKRAIEKHGWENVTHEILFDGLSKTEAEAKEIEMIQQYRSADKRYGYNTSPGGNALSEEGTKRLSQERKGHKQNKETLAKKSESLRKAHAEGKFDHTDRSFFKSEEYIQKRRESMLEKWKDPEFARMVTERTRAAMNTPEYKAKMSAIAKERNNRPEIKAKFSGANNGKSKRVMCLETGVVYPCAAEAGRQTGTYINGICMCCRGERESVGGYHWKYIGEEVNGNIR